MPYEGEEHAVTQRTSKSGGPSGRRGDGVRPDPATLRARLEGLRLDKTVGQGGRFSLRRYRNVVFCLMLLTAASTLIAYGRQVFTAEEVDSVKVSARSAVPMVLDATGYTVAPSKVKIGSTISGLVVEVKVEEGQKVRKGDLLARLDDTEHRADLEQARAGLDSANARLAELRKGARPEEVEQARAALDQAKAQQSLASKQFARFKALVNTVSRSEFDRIESEYYGAQARVQQAEQALRLVQLGAREEQVAAAEADVKRWRAAMAKAQYLLDHTRLLAPISGVVVERSVAVGEMAFGLSLVPQTAFVIADLSRLEVEIDVAERDLVSLRVGQACLITAEAYPDRHYQGVVDSFAAIFNRQRGIRVAKIRIVEPDDRLTLDMNCRVQVFSATGYVSAKETVWAPVQAVVRDGDKAYVHVVDGQVARRRPVRVGRHEGGEIEILEGLKPEEIVLLPGKDGLRDGQRVRPRAPREPDKSSGP